MSATLGSAVALILFASTPATTRAAGEDGTWYAVPVGQLPPPPDIGGRMGHTIIYDPPRQRFVLFGGASEIGGTLFNEVWERSVTSTGPWIPLVVEGTPPSPRSEHSAVYDAAGDRMLVFGGDDGSLRNDVWQLSLADPPTWTELAPLGTPPAPRTQHSGVFDPGRRRLMIFGGRTPAHVNDTWFLNCATSPPVWQQPVVAGTLPVERAGHAAIFDTGHDRMVMYGGLGSFYYFGDVWTLSYPGGLPTWTRQLVESTPTVREEANVLFDAAGNRMIMFGGRQYGYAGPSDLWALDLTSFTWSGPTYASTNARFGAGLAIAPSQGRAILHGGSTHLTALSDTWELQFPSLSWVRISPPPPPPEVAKRYGSGGIFDAARNRFVMAGGAFDVSYTINYLDDLAELVIGRDSSWVQIPIPSFGGRFGHSVVHDPSRDRMVIFGGYQNRVFRNDVWQIRFSPFLSVNQLFPMGTLPLPRDYHAAIYDPLRDRMIVYGGNNGGPLDDVWALDFSSFPTWTQLSPGGTPPPARMLHGGLYDPYADRMLIFGGFDGTSSMQDLWSLSLGGATAWSPMTPAGSPPPPRYGLTLQLDPNRQRALLYGGRNLATAEDLSDLWELPLGGRPLAWLPRSPGGTIPPGRIVHLALYDAVNDRMLVSGGASQGTLSDVWRLQFEQQIPTAATVSLRSCEARYDEVELHWDVACAGIGRSELQRSDGESGWRTSEVRSFSGACELVFRDRDVLAGRRYGYRLATLADHEATLSQEAWVDVPAGPELALAGFSPNPASGDRLRVEFSVPAPLRTTIDLLDVSGRRLASRVIESPAPGTASVELAPETPLPPGLNFVRLTQGARTLMRRGTVVR